MASFLSSLALNGLLNTELSYFTPEIFSVSCMKEGFGNQFEDELIIEESPGFIKGFANVT